jgi:hypothetical protein
MTGGEKPNLLDPVVKLVVHLDDNFKMLCIKSFDSNCHEQEVKIFYVGPSVSLSQPKHGAHIRNYALSPSSDCCIEVL